MQPPGTQEHRTSSLSLDAGIVTLSLLLEAFA